MSAQSPIIDISRCRLATITISAGNYQDFWLPPQINFRPVSVFFQDPTNCQLDISGSSTTVYNSDPGGGTNSHWITNINSSHLAWYQITAPGQVIRITNNALSDRWVDIVADALSAISGGQLP